jgi:hypothetical protein
MERRLTLGQQKRPLQKAAYGSLVRLRRLGEAIAALPPTQAYEGRILIRAMLEIYFNYAWMRLKQPHGRATRFLRFLAIERLKFLQSVQQSPDLNLPSLRAAIRAAKYERTRLRHLFRVTDAKGRRLWAKDWAGGLSVEARFHQVLTASAAERGSWDPFLYTLYRWFSGAAHGGPQSFSEVLEPSHFGLRPREQPEATPVAHYMGAGIVLLSGHAMGSVDLEYDDAWKERLGKHRVRYLALSPNVANTLGMPLP